MILVCRDRLGIIADGRPGFLGRRGNRSLVPDSAFSIPASPLAIPAGTSADLPIFFNPPNDGCFSKTLTLSTNDPESPLIQITLLAAVNCSFPAPQQADFSVKEGVFTSPLNLTLSSIDGATILYSLDGSIPGEESGVIYNGPIAINSTTQVRTATYLPGHPPAIRTRSYLKLDPEVQKELVAMRRDWAASAREVAAAQASVAEDVTDMHAK